MKIQLKYSTTLNGKTFDRGAILDVHEVECVIVKVDNQSEYVYAHSFDIIPEEPEEPEAPKGSQGLPAIFGQELKSLTVEFK